MIAFLVLGGLMLAFGVAWFLFPRSRSSKAGSENDWKNEAFAARERTGSWVENETWVGHDDPDPSSSFPGTP